MKKTETIPTSWKNESQDGNFPAGRKSAEDASGFSENYKIEIAKLGQNISEVDERLSFLGPYSYETDLLECQNRMNSMAIHRIFIGARLCRIQEHEGRERFVETINILNIKKTAAYEAVIAALKFINEQGEIKFPNLATLGIRKINALTYLDDADLEILDNGKSVNGLSIETVKNGSARKLESAIKELKAQNEALSKMIVKKKEENLQLTDQLEEMEKQVNRPVDWSARSAEILSELNKILMDASQLNGRLNALVDEVHGMQETEWTKEESVCLQQAKFVASTISDDASVTVDRLDWLAPKVNAAFFPGLNFNRGHADDADDADYTVVDGEGEDA